MDGPPQCCRAMSSDPPVACLFQWKNRASNNLGHPSPLLRHALRIVGDRAESTARASEYHIRVPELSPADTENIRHASAWPSACRIAAQPACRAEKHASAKFPYYSDP